MSKKGKQKLYKEISDVIFVPKKKSLFRKILLFVLFVIIVGGLLTAFLYDRGYFEKPHPTVDENNFVLTKGDEYIIVDKFSQDWCKGVETGGEEIYTDWFVIKGDSWKINFYSEKVLKDEDSNTRVWYTTSEKEMLDDLDAYTEIGENRYNVDSKDEEIKISGPGYYRLRILCWNSSYSIEVQDSE